MWGTDILFNLPQAAYLLLFLLPLLYILLALHFYRQRQQKIYTSSSLLPRLLIPRSVIVTYTKIGGWILIWLFVCLAFMDPYGNVRYTSLSSRDSSSTKQAHVIPHEVIFLVDTSASMSVPDGPDGETRLEEAKTIMEDVIRQLQGQAASLYTFTSELTTVVPATLDYLFLRLSIKELQIDTEGEGGTRFAPILKDLKEQAFPKPTPKRLTILMLTDGGDNQLEVLSGENLEKEKQSILSAISNPEQLHLRLYTIGIGSLKAQKVPRVIFEGKPVFSKLEPEILKQLAQRERGKYYMAQKSTSLNLAKQLISQIEEDEVLEAQDGIKERHVAPVKKDDLIVDLFYQIPLGLALLFYFLNHLLPDVRRL